MSTRPQRRSSQQKQSGAAQRGRAVKQGGPTRTFYLLLALIALVGTAAVVLIAFRTPQPVGTADPSAGQLPLESFPAKGQPDAPVTVVEYSDYQCPACASYANQMADVIDQKYVETGQVRFIYHDFPLDRHPNAVPAAEAARCAGDQEAYWPMHDMLFRNQNEWANLSPPTAQFVRYAEALNLDRAAFESCVNDGKYRSTILQAKQDAERAQIAATPTFVVDGRQYTARDLEQAIENALAAQR